MQPRQRQQRQRHGGVGRRGMFAGPIAASFYDEDPKETKLGPNVIASVRQLRDSVRWTPATVIQNDSANLDGSVRLLHVSVADHVDLLYGRKVQGVLDTDKWIASFTVPGQTVGVRTPDESGGGNSVQPTQLYNIASSPYESRRDSAYRDASIIEIVASRHGSDHERMLAEYGPGALIEVSQVIGRGFASMFNPASNVASAVEAGRPIVVMAIGTRGIAPVRAMLNSAPVQAHATRAKISCIYVTKSATTAAFLPGWDLWREAGVSFMPVYTEVYDPEDPANEGEVDALMEQVLFLREGGFASLSGAPSDVVVLLSGVGRQAAAKLSKKLADKGVEYDRMLFCDFF